VRGWVMRGSKRSVEIKSSPKMYGISQDELSWYVIGID
jgi:hypothetical protein